MKRSPPDTLIKDLEAGVRAAGWVKHSFKKCAPIVHDQPLTEQQFDDFEALTSRFARLSDIVIQKIFRGIDRALLEQSGSIVDAIHRAEKRGLCDARMMREIRELRNVIAHEYSIEDLRELFNQVYKLTEDLLVIFERTEEFVRKTGTF